MPNFRSTDKGLSHLAAIAEAVSMQQTASEMAQAAADGSSSRANDIDFDKSSRPTRNPFAAVSAALRKRSTASTVLVSLEVPAAKRSKTNHGDSKDSSESAEDGASDEDAKGVRFREYQAEIWSEKFEDLCEFRRHFGHCHVPHTYTHNAPLAQWVKRQRYQYKLKAESKRSTLSDERVRLLNKIGFIWNSHDVVWEERLNELVQFKQKNGHCIVPSNFETNPQLAVWVKRQRRQHKFFQEKKPTSMTSERIAKLDQIGFAWDCRKNTPPSDRTAHVPVVTHHIDASNRESGMQTFAPAMQHPHAFGLAHFGSTTLGSGFPMPMTPTIAAAKTAMALQHQSQIMAASRVATVQAPKGVAPDASNPLANLPCDFFSFSRKFTKFPKINLPISKY